MAAPLSMIILTFVMLEDVNSIPLPDVQDWSKFHIDIFYFNITNNSPYLYEILKRCRNIADVCH